MLVTHIVILSDIVLKQCRGVLFRIIYDNYVHLINQYELDFISVRRVIIRTGYTFI